MDSEYRRERVLVVARVPGADKVPIKLVEC